MKSKISFFNAGIFKNSFRRFWPLWAGWLVSLILLLPVTVVLSDPTASAYSLCTYDEQILDSGRISVILSAFVAVLGAMTSFGYLYQPRNCSMMAALPVRREAMFSTAFLAGLLPPLACHLIAAGIMLCMLPGLTGAHAAYVLQWLGISCMGYFSFYAFATFCAMLTSNLIVLPGVYMVLQMTFYIAETCARYILSLMIYGNGTSRSTLEVLSPFVTLADKMNVTTEYASTVIDGAEKWMQANPQFIGWNYLIGYTIAGVCFVVLSFFLYRSRRMETAGDVVAIRFLKPLFKYCLTVGCALVLPAAVFGFMASSYSHGLRTALVVLMLMLLGALIGFYAAEMMIQRTLRVFHTSFRGLLIVFGVIVVLFGVYESDLLGIEKYTPSADNVESVSVYAGFSYSSDSTFTSKEGIQHVIDLHKAIIRDKKNQESAKSGNTYSFTLTYTMKNGRTVVRDYQLSGDTLPQKAADVLNTSEGIISRFPSLTADAAMMVQDCTINYLNIGDVTSGSDTYWRSMSVNSTDAFELYTQYILRDAQEGTIARVYPEEDSDVLSQISTVTIDFTFSRPGCSEPENYVSVRVCMDSANTIQWLSDHTDITVCSQTQIPG